MKRLLSIIVSAFMLISLAACVPSEGSGNTGSVASDGYVSIDVNIGVIKGPTGVGMVSLMEKDSEEKAANNYSFSLVTDPQAIVGMISSGEVDIAAVPTNLASTLYKKTNGQIKVLAVNTYGVLSILENGESINSVEDLKGKTIYAQGEGANPEYILKHILVGYGLDPETDVEIKFVGTPDELQAKIVSGEAKIAMVPEPAATAVMTKVPTVRRVIDMTKEWDKISPESALMMGCVIVRSEFLEENPSAVAKFMEEYKDSVNSVTDIEAVASLCEKWEIIPSAAIAKNAIPNCHIAFCSGNDMKTKLGGYLKVLFDANPAAIGGALPDDNFYYLP